MSEPITEADLQAYIDDQLEPTRRIEVEGHRLLVERSLCLCTQRRHSGLGVAGGGERMGSLV